ncbi:hypothetical protein ACS0TY_025193 [Phlomoides rotata]
MQKLLDKKKALYSHSLPCVEGWFRSLGFHQSRGDRAVWFVEKLDWHTQLSIDVTDLYIRYALLFFFLYRIIIQDFSGVFRLSCI